MKIPFNTRKILAFLTSRRLKRTVLVVLTVFLAIILLSFIFRNTLLQYYLGKYTTRFNQAFHAELVVKQAHLRGVSSLEVQGIMLKPLEGDTLLCIDSLYASLGFWKLISGRIALDNLELKNTLCNFVKKDSLNNYMFLLDSRGKKSTRQDSSGTKNYAARMNSILEAAFDKIPNDLLISNFMIRSDYNGHLLKMNVDTFRISDHQFDAPITIEEDQKTLTWRVKGELDKYNHEGRFRLCGDQPEKLSIPFIGFRWNSEIVFDTLEFSLAEKESGSSQVVVSGQASLTGLRVRNARLAAEPIPFGKSSLDYTLNIGRDYVELDSTTTVSYDLLSVHPYLKYRAKPYRQLTFRLDKKDFPAQELFSSLPPGLFYNLQGMKTRGNLDFHLYFNVDLNLPDSLKFECELLPRKFSILSYGNTNLTMINDTFTHTAYEKGEAVKTFFVGPGNPNYYTLDQISPYLRNTILNTEDGSFFRHRGFNIGAFRESIATNIKQRRFARGGSTITMQLVKNVFLNRNKTMARKLEEAIIVWLIESQQLVTKERMYEVYLNIIEWGPGIYGAGEASRFYFDKDISKISFEEALFLASIIPRPKYFMYTFDKNTGQLKESMVEFFRRVAEKMLNKEMISQTELDQLRPVIELKGPSKDLMLKPDSLPGADSLFIRPVTEPE